ncbi:phosphohydrolase [Vibrio cholerae]|uniref:phosphohydrolase n=1 Tax=Vibrio cholerae TaxID=666 RepID=UPI000E0AE4FC|nr:phosphohydrolase [Vibrio cholerae]TQP09942.1 phosphohydrolase [Vibrio cholerae]TQQ11238.1 phosphohydrolase [Vibrio cholerae]TQQ48252.1 phosphohydrolase [Vibrio cholerae]TQQ71805.1 phosphohydrolase [Vibrio cholerae]TXZ44500.1 phosphohydrolase [Vibrio cholerae]
MSENTPASPSIYKAIFFVSLITCSLFCIVLLALLVCLPSPSLLSYLGYADSVALANADNINDPFTSHIIGELVKSGTLISLKDVWSFQTGFYQTIITVLIAINGLIAAISVIYIKSTSEEKAEEITKKYMHSDTFNHVLNTKVENEAESRLRVVQSDLNSTASDFERSLGTVDEALERLQLLETENQSLRQQIKVISERVAQLDISESEGKESLLVKKEQ